MNLNFLKNNLVFISSLVGFTTGSLATSFYQRNYYNHQLKEEIKAMLECQQAWEKYYSLTNQTSPTTQPITTNQSLWQLIAHLLQILIISELNSQ